MFGSVTDLLKLQFLIINKILLLHLKPLSTSTFKTRKPGSRTLKYKTFLTQCVILKVVFNTKILFKDWSLCGSRSTCLIFHILNTDGSPYLSSGGWSTVSHGREPASLIGQSI
jgi:hypothetical protein